MATRYFTTKPTALAETTLPTTQTTTTQKHKHENNTHTHTQYTHNAQTTHTNKQQQTPLTYRTQTAQQQYKTNHHLCSLLSPLSSLLSLLSTLCLVLCSPIDATHFVASAPRSTLHAPRPTLHTPHSTPLYLRSIASQPCRSAASYLLSSVASQLLRLPYLIYRTVPDSPVAYQTCAAVPICDQ